MLLSRCIEWDKQITHTGGNIQEKKVGIIKGKFSKIGVYRTTTEKNLLTKGEDSG